MMYRIPLALTLTAFGFLGYVGVHGIDAVQLRIDEIERSSIEEGRFATELAKEFHRALEELERLRAEMETTRPAIDQVSGVANRLEDTEGRLSSIAHTVEQQKERLELVSSAQEGFDPEMLDANVRDLSERWDEVYTMAASAAELAGESRVLLAELDRELGADRNVVAMWSSLLGPVVQLAGEDSIGSGIVIRGPIEGGAAEQVDYVLTAWHVVRDIQGSLYNREMPVPVAIYLNETTTRQETATLLDFDAEIDVALLRLDMVDLVENTARLGRHDRLRQLEIFDPVYAVGCPLGNDPIPTLGEVSATQHDVDGATYLMISAPTYVGNSGGGIFDAHTFELLGVFSKVYTHGSLRPTIVTHMGLVTPLQVVYDWMETTNYGFLVPDDEAEAALASAPK